MKTLFVLFDSLNRLALGAYGGTSIATPNFDRFAKKSVTFDNHYVGSLPCMPARRDMHTGRLNFTHRNWGPLEPFDESFARILSNNNVYTHLISDHLHYFENGGWGYANAFDSWDFVRGQEYDALKVMARPPIERYRERFDERHYPLNKLPEKGSITRGNSDKTAFKRLRGAITEDILKEEDQFPTAQCFSKAFEFLDNNRGEDDWFLQLECFDPHEPFVAPDRFKAAYDAGYNGKILNWPMYEKNRNSPEEIAAIRGNYAALVAMCDEYFGRLIDYFDEHNLWKDTALILTTDHGFLLSEHDWWAKNRMPYYEEISHIPLMVWHPFHHAQAGNRRKSLTQTIDLMPTFLDLHNCKMPKTVTGNSLVPALSRDIATRESQIFGMFGGPVGITDGTYTYYRYPEDLSGQNLHLYTLMPAHMVDLFDIGELQTSELAPPFDFTKGAPTLRMKLDPKNTQVGQDGDTLEDCETTLYNVITDPRQETRLTEPEVEKRFEVEIADHFTTHDAPQELFKHFDLVKPNVALKGD